MDKNWTRASATNFLFSIFVWSVIINLFHPTSAEDRLVVVKRRICTRYLNYFNPFNVFAINEATFVSGFSFFASRRIASNILPAYIPPCGSMTEWTYFANLFPPFRIGFSIVKGDACYTVFTYRSNLKTRENTYVRIYERIELDREEYILSVAAILQPMNTFKTVILLFEVDSISRELAFSS